MLIETLVGGMLKSGAKFLGVLGCSTLPMIKHDDFVGHFFRLLLHWSGIHWAGIQGAPTSKLNFAPAVISSDFWT